VAKKSDPTDVDSDGTAKLIWTIQGSNSNSGKTESNAETKENFF
jgi:hypothetical protein